MTGDEVWDDERTLRGAILDEPIEALGPAKAVCVSPHATHREAIEAMNAVKVGCVLVTEGQDLLGILTERDILRQVVGKLDLDTPVERSMTRHPETVRPQDGIAFALNKMATGGYRHIPVVDDQGHPVGVVSVRDLVRFIVSLFPGAVLNLPPHPDLSIASTAEGA